MGKVWGEKGVDGVPETIEFLEVHAHRDEHNVVVADALVQAPVHQRQLCEFYYEHSVRWM